MSDWTMSAKREDASPVATNRTLRSSSRKSAAASSSARKVSAKIPKKPRLGTSDEKNITHPSDPTPSASNADPLATMELIERDLEEVKNKMASVESEIKSINTKYKSIDTKYESIGTKIESIEQLIEDASAKAEMENPPHPGAEHWMDKVKQLWDKTSQLRDEAIQLLGKNNQLLDEENQLRDKKKQLWDEENQLSAQKNKLSDIMQRQRRHQESRSIAKLEGITELANRINAPSTFGRLSDWPKIGGIYHHRPPGPAVGALHVSLFSAALGNFCSKCEAFAVASKSQVARDFVQELCIAMSAVYDEEMDRQECFNDRLTSFLSLAKTGYVCFPLGGYLDSDGSIIVYGSNSELMLLNVQVKNEKGLTASDCVMQNLAYFIKYWGAPRRRTPHPRPRSFLLSLEGCVLHVHGAVVVNGKVHTNELCPPLTLMLQPDIPRNMERLVVLADALRDGLKELHNEMNNDQPPGSIFPYLVELKTSKGSLKFKYEEELSRRVFVARLEDSDERVVVKFSPRGLAVELQNLLSDHDLAPRLLAHDFIQSTWYVSLCEYTPDTAGDDPFTKKQKEQLKEAVKLMHDNGWVHGDLRLPNILRVGQTQRIHIVDFEFAGREDEVVYPLLLNRTSIKWPEGVAAGLPLKKAHDAEMLEWICGD